MRNTLPAILVTLATAGPTLGDGGVVRHVEVVGSWRVTAFTTPTPLRAGAVDLSFFVQDVDTGEAILDAAIEVRVALDPGGMGPPRSVAGHATREDSTNRLLYAALLDLRESGAWDVTATITTGADAHDVSFGVAVGPPLGSFRMYLPWFGLPIAGLAMFVAHQVLVFRARTRGRSQVPTAVTLAPVCHQ